MKVFLGGTCNESKWREQLIKLLKIDYFNPVVDDWTPACMQEELKQRAQCDYVLYVITPLMTGVYSVAELIDDSNKRPEKTLFCLIQKDEDPQGNLRCFTKGQLISFTAVIGMILKNGAKNFFDLNQVAEFLNQFEKGVS